MPEIENETPVVEDKPIDDNVPYDKYRKLLSQRKTDQEVLKQLNTKLETYEKKLKEMESSHPATDYKSLLETRNRELEDLNKKVTDRDRMIQDYEEKHSKIKKLSAFNEELPAKLKRKEYYAHVDLDKIVVDPDSGEIDRKSLKSYAQQFAEDFKDLLDLKGGPNLPNARLGGKPSLSYDEWLKLPPAEMKKRQGEVRE
jgi:DNA repair exonuclease SbcCD ATPase subunit